MAKDIMYVGLKPSKRDNVCPGHEQRVWSGLGAVVAVSEIDADKLCRHSDIWLDVSGKSEKERSAIIAKLQDERRERERAQAVANRGAITLKTATDDELDAEVKLRKKHKGKAENNPDPKLLPTGQSGSMSNEGNERDRPTNTDSLIADIVGVIAEFDVSNKSHFDSNGKPHIEAVIEVLGYKISNSELQHALDVVGN